MSPTPPACKQPICASTCLCPVVPDYITVTGAIATLTNAGTILSQYLQSFGNNPSQFKQLDTYIPISPPSNPTHKPLASQNYPADTHFHVSTTLPAGIPLPTVSSEVYGAPFSTKLMAKRAAYLVAVQELHKKGELNDALEPTPGGEPPKPKKVKKIREGRSAASLSRWRMEGDKALGEDMGDMQHGLNARERWEVWKDAMKEQIAPPTAVTTTKPVGVGEYVYDVWPEVLRRPLERKEAHATMLEWKGGDARRLLLLTSVELCSSREELPIGPVEKEAVMVLHNLGTVHLHKEQYASARAYTERMMRSQLNKPISSPSDEVTWLVLPIKDDTIPRIDKVRKCIDFEEVTACLGDLTTPFSTDPAVLANQTIDALQSAITESSQRGRVVLRTDLTPQSPFPGKEDRTILQVASSGAKAVDGPAPTERTVEYPNQPTLEIWPVNSGRSGGAITTASNKPHYVIPEFTRRYCVPYRTYITLSLIPHFFIALCDRLVAREANQHLFGGAIDDKLMRQALTAPMMYPNMPEYHYERLELMGDTIIKLVAVLDTCNSGELTDDSHVQRHLRLSNRSLRDNGLQAGITRYIRAARETTRNWMPAGWKTGQGDETVQAQRNIKIGDKVVADVVEAIVGAAYISSQRSLDVGISAMKRMAIPVLSLTSWQDLMTESLEAKLDDIELLDYRFRHRPLRLDCFNLDPKLRSTQRWLKWKITGDALLDYFVIEYLWDQYPAATPAQITHMKHSRCGDACLAALVVHLGLHKHIHGYDGKGAGSSVSDYVKEVTMAKEAADAAIRAAGTAKGVAAEDEEENGNRPGVEYWDTAPRSHVLGDIPELLLGAMLQDSGFDMDAVRSVFTAHFQSFFERYCIGPISRSNHPKSQFMVHMSALGCGGWVIDRSGEDGKDDQGSHVTTVKVHDKVAATRKGSTPAIATRLACAAGLKIVKKEWLRDICTCPGRKF